MFSTYSTIRKAQYNDQTVLAKDELKRGNLLLKMYSNLKLIKLNANVRSQFRQKTQHSTNSNTTMRNRYALPSQPNNDKNIKINNKHKNNDKNETTNIYDCGNMSQLEIEIVYKEETLPTMAGEHPYKQCIELQKEETQQQPQQNINANANENESSDSNQRQLQQQQNPDITEVCGGMNDTNHSNEVRESVHSKDKDVTTDSIQHSNSIKKQFSKDEIVFNEEQYQELQVCVCFMCILCHCCVCALYVVWECVVCLCVCVCVYLCIARLCV